jgi:hypothetical protein
MFNEQPMQHNGKTSSGCTVLTARYMVPLLIQSIKGPAYESLEAKMQPPSTSYTSKAIAHSSKELPLDEPMQPACHLPPYNAASMVT